MKAFRLFLVLVLLVLGSYTLLLGVRRAGGGR
jgi:hypothetical protein